MGWEINIGYYKTKNHTISYVNLTPKDSCLLSVRLIGLRVPNDYRLTLPEMLTLAEKLPCFKKHLNRNVTRKREITTEKILAPWP